MTTIPALPMTGTQLKAALDGVDAVADAAAVDASLGALAAEDTISSSAQVDAGVLTAAEMSGAAKQGNGTVFGMVSGGFNTGDFLSVDPSGNIIADAPSVMTDLPIAVSTTADYRMFFDVSNGDALSRELIAGGGGDMTVALYDPAAIAEQLVGLTAAQTLENKIIDNINNSVAANSIHAECRNESGGTLVKGDAVYISGYSVGQSLALVSLADSDASATMPALAITNSVSIANNANGEFVLSGRVDGFDTSAFSVGDELYISGTGTSGNTLTATKPTGTGLIQKVAVVLRSHATLGVIFVVGAERENDTPNVLTQDLDAGAFRFIGADQTFMVAVSDEDTALATGTAKLTFRMPYAFTLSEVRASVKTAPTGSVLTVDINEGGVTILSTKLTIDATEKTSTTAAAAAVISDGALADDAEITIDIDTIGSTVAGAGLKIVFKGKQP